MARLSNLDLNGKLVKRGLLVSWHGVRYEVSRVRMGRCFAFPVDLFGHVLRDKSRILVCESVQVIA